MGRALPLPIAEILLVLGGMTAGALYLMAQRDGCVAQRDEAAMSRTDLDEVLGKP